MRIETDRLIIRDLEQKESTDMYECKRYAVAEKSGFELFEKRTPIGHKQPNMISDSYYYYRKYRNTPLERKGENL